ncbi:MAG: FtsQ-type POTRA domain-containing protein, partial [Chloroflexi bacterium]
MPTRGVRLPATRDQRRGRGVRIRLADEDRSHRDRPANRKRRKSRRGRTFDAALPMPQAPARRSGASRSRPSRGPVAPEKQRARRSRPAIRKRTKAEAQPARAQARASASSLAVRLGVLLLMGLLVAGIVYGSTDAQFFVYQAGVIGAQHLSAEGIYQAAEIHEQNIFWVDPADVARRIARLDGIKVARVRCELPAVVTIEVEERQPRVMWRTVSQGRDWWLDEEGMVLPYHGDAQAAETLFVVDSSQRELDFGQEIQPEGIVASVIQLAAALPQSRIFFYDAERGLSFAQKGEGAEWPVYVGS